MQMKFQKFDYKKADEHEHDANKALSNESFLLNHESSFKDESSLHESASHDSFIIDDTVPLLPCSIHC